MANVLLIKSKALNGDEQASTADPIIISLSDRPAKHDEAVLRPACNNFFRLIIKLGHFKEQNFYFELTPFQIFSSHIE